MAYTRRRKTVRRSRVARPRRTSSRRSYNARPRRRTGVRGRSSRTQRIVIQVVGAPTENIASPATLGQKTERMLRARY